MAEEIQPPPARAIDPDLYRIALEHIDEIVYCVSADPLQGSETGPYVRGTVLFVSGRVSAIIGLDPNDFAADQSLWFRSVHPDDVDGLLGTTARIIHDRQPRTRHYRLRHGKTGEYHWFEDKVVPTIGPDNTVIGYVGVARDVTERMRAEQLLRESEARYRAVMDSGSDGILAVSNDGTIAFVNAALGAMFGYSRDELIGQPVEILVPECAQSIHVADRDAYLRAPRSRPMGVSPNLRGRRKDGSIFPVDIDLSPIPSSSTYRVRATVRDLTELRKLEERIRQSEKIEAIGRLAGGIAHDFNNLLAVIVGGTDLLIQQSDPNDPQLHELRQVLEAAERASALTAQLLSFSRRQEVELSVVDIKSVVEHLRPLLRRLIPERIHVATDLRGGLDPVRADRSQLEQVVLNLVLNARDAIADQGRIEIAAEHVTISAYEVQPTGPVAGSYVRLTVSDDGCGMSAETLQHLFEPFFTTKEVGQGTGLGLATVYGIVKQAGGDVRVESRPGEGSTFYVYWPRIIGVPGV